MSAHRFVIPNPGGADVVIERSIADDGEAILLAKRFAKDWPDAPRVDVSLGDLLIHREFNVPASASS